MDADEIHLKLTKILAETLEIAEGDVNDDISGETCANWDSVRHLSVVLAVEDAFGIMFEEQEIPEITRFGRLLSAVHDHLVA